jgi:hypothetical protein
MGTDMSGRARLPAGAVRRASQRRSRPAAPKPTGTAPRWRPGDPVRWKEYNAFFLQIADDDENWAEIMIGMRRYRVARREIMPG